jgi:hypothetical protein
VIHVYMYGCIYIYVNMYTCMENYDLKKRYETLIGELDKMVEEVIHICNICICILRHIHIHIYVCI